MGSSFMGAFGEGRGLTAAGSVAVWAPGVWAIPFALAPFLMQA